MTHSDYWIKVFGIEPDGGPDEDIHTIAEILDRNMYGNRPGYQRSIAKNGVLTLLYMTEKTRDEMVQKLIKEMGERLLLRFPIRVGKEEWSIPHDAEALMLQSVKGIQP